MVKFVYKVKIKNFINNKIFLKFMAPLFKRRPLFGRRLSKGQPLQGKVSKINPKVAINREKMKKIIENIRKEDNKINEDLVKLLNESKKNSWNIKELEKIDNDSLKELKKYIKLMKNLYGNNLNNLNKVYPEIIQLEKHIKDLNNILKDIKKKGLSMDLGKKYYNMLNSILNLWKMHMNKISKT
jgi:seryl-tRNA synthetase